MPGRIVRGRAPSTPTWCVAGRRWPRGRPRRHRRRVFLNVRGGRLSRQSAWQVLRDAADRDRRSPAVGCLAAHPAAFVRHPPAGGRRRRPIGAGTARPRLGDHHPDLHAGHGRLAARGLRHGASAGQVAGSRRAGPRRIGSRRRCHQRGNIFGGSKSMYQLFRSTLLMAASVRLCLIPPRPRPSQWLPPRPEDRPVPTVGKSAPAQCLTSDMVLVHKVFRRELRLLPALVARRRSRRPAARDGARRALRRAGHGPASSPSGRAGPVAAAGCAIARRWPRRSRSSCALGTVSTPN